MAGRPEGFAPRAAVAPGFGVAPVFEVAAAVFEVTAEFFEVTAELFVCGVADRATVRGADEAVEAAEEDDGVGDGSGAGGGDGAGGREGCAGMPIAGASACTPIRLLPMATARIAPTTDTGQPTPRSRRPRTPDWSTKTGAEAGSSKLDSYMSDGASRADSRSTEVMTGRTLRGLSVQGT
ncbi:hypothetical protein ACFY0G_11570 [Streptomyces sp. NPDC001552]|uniref:hypothetical protein n=1 Tax=Streptomyces sp. NPDC001552 TaxID=3364587 RepID=UPI0036A0ED27